MNTEKATINLGIAELGKIDFLVDKGLYTNRSDFIRTAVRNYLLNYSNDVNGFFVETLPETIKSVGGIGIVNFSKFYFEDLKVSNTKIKLKVIGVLIIDKNVPPELFAEVVVSAKVYGNIAAGTEIKKIIEDLRLLHEQNA